MKIGAVADHRSREGGAIIYPVYSRRSKGLSVGINLFPDRKICSFDCPYCEVFPFETDIAFNPQTMESALRSAICEAKENNIPVKDICFSGNGEPSMSPFFFGAVNAAAAIRSELVPESQLVLITNGTGLLNSDTFQFLKNAAASSMNLTVWLKLDAATQAWFAFLNRSDISFTSLISRFRDFASSQVPFTIQTMICKINGALPPPEENAAWVRLVTELALLSAPAKAQANLKNVQIYGKARPAPEDPLAEAAPLAVLEERAALLRAALKDAGITVPVEVYE
jgi:histidinol dehydrogenase